ncbi:sigma-70 family RNA polymerase sigma factor [Nocardioides sp.]|uniref:sigma-70 family RNA polymerase sigma factor n=1 Tax=Nocardioides sp. TaxID=35761 RepID=UPI0039E59E44
MTSDPDLIARTRAGDTEAYSTLFERHREAAARLARQLARGESDADDLVAEAFTRVLSQLREGKGPDVAFRAYLLTTLRHVHFRRHNAEKRVAPTDDLQVLDQPVTHDDPVISSFDNAAAGRAFGSLPERWQMILWHLEVEGQRPAEVAELLGMKPNAVSALAYRAREALRQAYLLQHIADAENKTCVTVLDLLPAYVRGKLGRREKEKVRRHLPDCASCSTALAELTDMNSHLSAFLAPVILGAAATPYLQGVGAPAFTLFAHPWEKLQHWIHFASPATAVVHRVVVAGVGVAVAGAASTGMWAAWPSPADSPAGRGSAPTSSVSPSGPGSPLPSSAGAVTMAPPESTAPSTGQSSAPATEEPTSSAPASSTTSTAPTDGATSTEAATVAPLRVSFSSVPAGLSVSLQASATGGKGARKYTWDLGDGTTARGRSVSHTYAASGSYTVQLTVTDRTRSVSTARAVAVYSTNQPPQAAFSADVVGTTVSFDATASSDSDGSIVSYSWDFGDDATGSGLTVSHTYAASGEYVVRLTVTDDRGTRASRVVTVTIS